MATDNSLSHLLSNVDQAHLEAAAKQVIAVATDFADEATLAQQLVDAGVSSDTVRDLQTRLESDPTGLDAASLAVLSLAWDDPERRAVVEGAIAEAKTKLPVIEVGLLAMALIYAIHTYHTKGKKREVVIVRRDASGNIETTTETEWADASAPIRGIVDALTFGVSPRSDSANSNPPELEP